MRSRYPGNPKILSKILCVPDPCRELEEDPLGLLVFQGSGPHGPQYCLDIAGVLQMVRLMHLDSVIR